MKKRMPSPRMAATDRADDAAYWTAEVAKIAHAIAMTMNRDVEAEAAATAALERAKAIVRICYGVTNLDAMYGEGA